MTNEKAPERVMWLGNVRNVPYRQRVVLTAKAGFDCLSTSPMDYRQTRESGLSDADIRAIAADHGVRLDYLDPLTTWVPDGSPIDADPALTPYLNTSPDEFFRIAEVLQVERLHLIACFPSGRYTIAELTEYFGKTADRAAVEGYKCLIEAMPLWSGLQTIDAVWQIVKDADRKNTGIIFDTWHYVRAGRNDDLLKNIPAGTFDTIQIADGPLRLPPGRSMLHDGLFHRVPIGAGEIPNWEILKILQAAGHISSVGPEIFSEVSDSMSGEKIMERIVPGFETLMRELQISKSGY